MDLWTRDMVAVARCGLWRKPRTRPMPAPRSSALRYYASTAQDMHSRACGVCMPEAVGVRSLRAARERPLPSAPARELRSSRVHRASCDD